MFLILAFAHALDMRSYWHGILEMQLLLRQLCALGWRCLKPSLAAGKDTKLQQFNLFHN